MLPEIVLDERMIYLIGQIDSTESLRAIHEMFRIAKIRSGHQAFADALDNAVGRIHNRHRKEFDALLHSLLGYPLSENSQLFGDIEPECQFVDKAGEVWDVVTVSHLGSEREQAIIQFSLVCLSDGSKMELYYLEASGTLVTNLNTKEIAGNFYENPKNSSVLSGRVILND